MEKLSKWFFLGAVIGIVIVWACRVRGSTVPPEERIGAEPFVVECTAYCDEGLTASGKPTVEGLTISGAREWLGCVIVVYEVGDDGAIGDFVGIYQCTDTGYGRDGDILRGETVDIYMSDRDACMQCGRRKVYIQIIDGVG